MSEKTLDFLFKINDLQKTKRYGNYPLFSESTSEHTFKLVLIVDYFYKELDLHLNYEKCICLSLYHDFGEMDMAKDIDIKESTDKNVSKYKEISEQEKIEKLSKKYYPLIKSYYKEYKSKETQEALFVNACDKLEGMIHPLTVNEVIMNHELFATYADKAIKNFPQLLPTYKQVKKILKKRFEEWNFEWKEEYDAIFEQ